jgi:hypothetical protein
MFSDTGLVESTSPAQRLKPSQVKNTAATNRGRGRGCKSRGYCCTCPDTKWISILSRDIFMNKKYTVASALIASSLLIGCVTPRSQASLNQQRLASMTMSQRSEANRKAYLDASKEKAKEFKACFSALDSAYPSISDVLVKGKNDPKKILKFTNNNPISKDFNIQFSSSYYPESLNCRKIESLALRDAGVALDQSDLLMTLRERRNSEFDNAFIKAAQGKLKTYGDLAAVIFEIDERFSADLTSLKASTVARKKKEAEELRRQQLAEIAAAAARQNAINQAYINGLGAASTVLDDYANSRRNKITCNSSTVGYGTTTTCR